MFRPFHKSLKHLFLNHVNSVVREVGSPRSRPFRNGLTTGFSLVELVVAVSILIILSTTFLFNYGNFDRRVTVDILAHQIATWVHDAQVSAMSVKRTRNAAGKFPGYGLHFELAKPKQFIYFADSKTANRIYDPLVGSEKCGDATVECEQVVTLLQGNVVASLCGDKPLGAQSANCVSVTPGSPLLYTANTLDILFARPDPFNASITGDSATAYSHAEITVSSPKGYKHTVIVWMTGQVTVK